MVVRLKKAVKILTCTLIAFLSIIGNGGIVKAEGETISAKEYIDRYENYIISACRKTGVFPSIMLGQLILESGTTLSDLALKENNMFGIKWAQSFEKEYPGSYPVEYWTSEYGQGTMGTFASFPSVEDCILEKSKIWWNGMYENDVIPVLYDLDSTPQDVAKAIAISPYQTTGVSYGTLLIQIIEENNFEEYDKKAFPDGRKLVGYGDRIKGEYNYPNDEYNSDSVKNVGSATISSSGNLVITDEKDLEGMYPSRDFSNTFSDITLPTVDGLSTSERVNLLGIRDSIREQKWTIYDNLRVSVVFLGLCTLSYAMVFLVAYMFDRSNTLFDISLLGVVSLGKLRYSSEGSGKNLVDSRRLVKVEVITVIVGLFLVSGGIFSLLVDVMYWLV